MIDTSYRGKAILTRLNPLNKYGDSTTKESIEVRVLAAAEGWAMVRRKGCSPFICGVKELEAVKK